MRRPIEVALFVVMIAASCLVGLAHLLIIGNVSFSVGTVVGWVLGLVIIYLYLRAIWSGRKWAWWLALFLGVTGLLYLPWSYKAVPTESGKVLYLAQAVVGTVATALLLLPRARAWFRPNSSAGSFRSTPGT